MLQFLVYVNLISHAAQFPSHDFQRLLTLRRKCSVQFGKTEILTTTIITGKIKFREY